MPSAYIHIYTGNGKGKTTAALGLALRAAGHNKRTYIGQFMKGQEYGELDAIKAIPQITIEQYGDKGCIRKEEVTQKHIDHAKAGLAKAREAMMSGEYDIVVLDEVNVALWFELLNEEDVLAFVDQRPEEIELVMTGRKVPESLIEKADLVTEMKEIRHYYAEGVTARRGIEF